MRRRQRRNCNGRGRHDGDDHHGSITSDTATAIATPVLVLHPKVATFKRRRKRRTVAAGVIGGVAGGILLSPLGIAPAGVVLGVLTAATAAKVVGKHRQARLVRRLVLQEAAARRS